MLATVASVHVIFEKLFASTFMHDIRPFRLSLGMFQVFLTEMQHPCLVIRSFPRRHEVCRSPCFILRTQVCRGFASSLAQV